MREPWWPFRGRWLRNRIMNVDWIPYNVWRHLFRLSFRLDWLLSPTYRRVMVEAVRCNSLDRPDPYEYPEAEFRDKPHRLLGFPWEYMRDPDWKLSDEVARYETDGFP